MAEKRFRPSPRFRGRARRNRRFVVSESLIRGKYMDKVRYAWPDVLKFFGILLVLWMHVKIATHADWNILIFAW